MEDFQLFEQQPGRLFMESGRMLIAQEGEKLMHREEDENRD
jgi:hypothetical protein